MGDISKEVIEIESQLMKVSQGDMTLDRKLEHLACAISYSYKCIDGLLTRVAELERKHV